MTGSEHRCSRRRLRRSLAAAAGVAALAVALAACSSGSSSTSSSGAASSGAASSGAASATAAAATSSCMAAANAYLKPWDSLPTQLSSTYTPLTAKPAPGGTVIKLVNGTIPSDGQSYQQQAIAAKAIGWTAKEIIFDGTVADLNAKFMQAVSEKPTAITVSGWPPAELQRPLAAAKAAGIVVGLSSVSDLASSYPGYASNTNGAATAKEIGEMNAYMFMRDSGCKGSVAIFNLPFPILVIGTNAFQATVKAHCPDCTVSYNVVQSSDIGTPALPSAVVSALQASPKTKYVYAIIGNVADGLAPALTQAGITGVKIFGQVPDATSIAALRNGTNAWWIDQNSLMNGWTELDGILRVMQAKNPISDTGGYPLAILTPQNVGTGTGIPVLPADYQSEFQKLWGVG
jgi:ABC-type sugar transport system substrate-binding protein